MFNSIGRTVILVRDYDEALAYYRDVLGFETLVDLDAGGGMRYLHIGLPRQEDVGLWLLEATSDADRKRVGNQTGPQPCLVLYTDDAASAHDTLLERGADILRPLVENDGAAFFHIADLYGNEIVVVEIKDDPSSTS